MREEAAALPQLDPVVQDEFIDVLCAEFDAIDSILTADLEPVIRPEIFQSLIFLVRLLQFDLGFRGAWTAKAKGASNRLVSTLFRLALVSKQTLRFPILLNNPVAKDPWFWKTRRPCSISFDC
jgi:mediator of RNA polymerase II transcription subunit 12